MKKFCFIFLLAWIAAAGLLAQESYFLKTPSITPNGKQIVFSCDDDLWAVAAEGGVAMRLTGLPGAETHPRVSPDGRWLAFANNQNGNSDVYVMPLAGGEIRQLTFNDAAEQPSSWSWDGQWLYFTSYGFNDFTAFKVRRAGGTPQRLAENYFNTPHDVVEHPASRDLYFTDSWERSRFAWRKGYRGEYNPDIKSFNPQTGAFKVHTTFRGKDFQPVIDKDGNLYFISDEGNNEFNLYQLLGNERRQLTSFPTSILNIQVAASGGKVVFEKDYQIWLYDTAQGAAAAVPIRLAKYDRLQKEQDFTTDGKISAFDVSADGQKIALVSRGMLFVADIKGKFVRQLPTAAAGRVEEVKWLADSRTLLYNRTASGWLNLFTIRADGLGGEKQITGEAANQRQIGLNHRRDRAVYLSGRNDLRLLDLAAMKSETLAKEELWGFYNDPPRFSPDDRYLAFCAYRNFEKDILLYDLTGKKVLNLTDSGVSEAEPCWSPDGKFLYFSCDRFAPNYPRGTKNSRIYRLPLQALDQDFKSTEWARLFSEPAKAADGEKTKKDASAAKEQPPPVTIDFSDMAERWEPVSPDRGQQASPLVIAKDGGLIALYISDHDGNPAGLWKTVDKPFEETVTVKIAGAETDGLALAAAKDAHYVLVKGVIQTLDLNDNKVTPIKIRLTFRKNLRAEFDQMFYETWASLQENYYDENFHGRDWDKVKKHYEGFLPFVQSRADLRTLLSDMLGELNSSHLAFRSQGDEEKTFFKMQTMQTGIVFANDDPYTVHRVVRHSPADKKNIGLRPGDVLVEVNGDAVDPAMNRDAYFTAASPDPEMTLVFRRGDQKLEVKLHPEMTAQFKDRLYDEWIAANQKRVDETGGGRIAYVYMKDMGDEELQRFLKEMTSEWYRRDALILDLRFNTGGNVHDDVLDFLSRKSYLQWKYRGGRFAPQPNFATAEKPMVLLVNEQSLSDAEMTAAGFKALRLGKIIGTETYRWLIFTSNKELVDGSVYRLPSWGCYTLEGEDIELNGVKPDITVQTTFQDRLQGKDPQLERAVAEVLRQLAEKQN